MIKDTSHCYQDKEEQDLNQSKVVQFFLWTGVQDSRNNADFPKIHNIFRINCFVLAIALVREIVLSLAKIQITA